MSNRERDISRFNIKQKILSIAQSVLEDQELSAAFDVMEAYRTSRSTGVRAFYEFDSSFSIPKNDPMVRERKSGFVDILSITPREESWNSLFNALVYCRYFVRNTNLNEMSRDFIRRSCDYVENCAKYLLSSLEPTASLKYPLGNIINTLKRKELKVPIDLLDRLEAFNREIYSEAKHKYDLPPGQHLYTPEEAFLVYFVAKKLGCKLRELVRPIA